MNEDKILIFTDIQDSSNEYLSEFIASLLKENEQLKNNWYELKKYIDENKLVLQNLQILDYYLKMQELLQFEKESDN